MRKTISRLLARLAFLVAAIAVVVATVALLVWLGHGAWFVPRYAVSSAPYVDTGKACRANPHANVHVAIRLIVMRRCVHVQGIVHSVNRAPDGDMHVSLALAPADTALLDQFNVSGRDGHLVTEIVPADQPGCTHGQPPIAGTVKENLGVCTGADVPTPAVGDRVQVVGPLVIDAEYGWIEVHPVWSVTVLATGQRLPPAPARITRLPGWLVGLLHTLQHAEARWHQGGGRQLVPRLFRHFLR